MGADQGVEAPAGPLTATREKGISPMAETGFRYFIEFMQARNAPPKPKPRFDYLAAPASPSLFPNEDYTGAACLLHTLTHMFPVYLEVLVDAEDLERLSSHRWGIVQTAKKRDLRVTNTRKQYLHTVVMNAPKGMVVDHIFHRTLDARKSQLRVVTARENNINTRPRSGRSSKYKGVQRDKKTGKWFVQAGPRGQRVFIGGFDSEADAAAAYNNLARSLYGSMAYQNPV